MNDQSPVTIYVRYLELPTSTTGNLEPVYNSVGALNGYIYTPKASGQQFINFRTKDYIAAETMELFSENYEPALISYTNPWVNVQFTIPSGVVPDGKIVKCTMMLIIRILLLTLLQYPVEKLLCVLLLVISLKICCISFIRMEKQVIVVR